MLFPQLQFFQVVQVVALLSWCRGFFTRSRLCRTMEIPQLLDTVIYVPVVQVVLLPGCGLDVQKTVAIPTGAVLGHGVHTRSWCVWCRSWCSSKVIDSLFVPQRQLSMVQTFRRTTEIPQLPYTWWLMSLLFLHPCYDAEAVPDCSADLESRSCRWTRRSMPLSCRSCSSCKSSDSLSRYRGFPMSQTVRLTIAIPQSLLDTVIDVPVVPVVQVVAQFLFLTVQTVVGPKRFPRCNSFTRCSTSRCAGPAVSSGAGCEKSFEIPQLQLVVFLLGQCCYMPVVCSDICLVVQRQVLRSRQCLLSGGGRRCVVAATSSSCWS